MNDADSSEPTPQQLDGFAAFALELAEASRALCREYFRSDLTVDSKADETPVTLADREVETLLRTRIQARYPDHGVLGEEQGLVGADDGFLWVLDPIDGTKQFICGKGGFGTLIALSWRGRPLIGVIEMPILGERWVGVVGGSSHFEDYRGRHKARVRSCPALSAAVLATTAPEAFDAAEFASFQALRGAVSLTIYGNDCYGYALLASGYLDLVVEAGLRSYDFMALVPVIEGAGGKITDWQGQPLGLKSDGRVLAAGDAAAHRAALGVLGGL